MIMIDESLFIPKPISEFKVGDVITWDDATRIGILREVYEHSACMFISSSLVAGDAAPLLLNEVVSVGPDSAFRLARPMHFGYFSGLLMNAGFDYPNIEDDGTMVLVTCGADEEDCDCEECDHEDCDCAEGDDVLAPIIKAGIHTHPTVALDACLRCGMDVTPADVVAEVGTKADEVPVLIHQIVDFDEDGTVTEDCTPVLEYADGGSSGMDVCAVIRPDDSDGVVSQDGKMVSYMDIPAGGRCLVHTNLKVACPRGYELQVRPRSGLALRHGITVLNSPGTVDSSYRGEVGVILINHGTESFRVFAGDRIAQLVLAPVAVCKWYKVGDLPLSDRDGGFGHTGVK